MLDRITIQKENIMSLTSWPCIIRMNKHLSAVFLKEKYDNAKTNNSFISLQKASSIMENEETSN